MLAGPVTPLEKVVPFSPATPEMVNVLVLNTICPRRNRRPLRVAHVLPRIEQVKHVGIEFERHGIVRVQISVS